MPRQAYYRGQSCDANIRTTHPDGSPRPCAKTGPHARLDLADHMTYARGDVQVVLGPFRSFFCDQHVEEFDAGLNVFDPARPPFKKGRA